MALFQKFRSRFGRFFYLSDRITGYKLALRSPPGINHVLPDLAEFCRAGEMLPPSVTDPFTVGRAIGRLDVWLRIQQHLNLSDEEIFALLKGQSILRPEDFNG